MAVANTYVLLIVASVGGAFVEASANPLVSNMASENTCIPVPKD